MRLCKIKLAGFKSFVDPTTVELPGNIIGIVGPNGCGKSNIIDAVRWVMGESSAKHLRGSSMADVIFSGSSTRKPVGQASIELVFDNSDQSAGGQYASFSEISVKRLVTRDGQSDYFLNGTKCRRKDITDLFLGTGLGPRSYAIIEQGMISNLIEAKPDELRVYIEEAAGISKYKERRKETESRLKSTRENMERLTDLRDEIGKQLERLKRQARQAERYKTLKQEEQRVRGELLVVRLRGMREAFASTRQEIETRQTELEARIAELRSTESQIEKQREHHVACSDEFNTTQGTFYSVGSEIARLEQTISHRRQLRQDLQAQIAGIEQNQTKLIDDLENEKQRLAEQDRQIAELEPSYKESQQQQAELTDELAQADELWQQWQEEWEAFQARESEPLNQAQAEKVRIEQLEQRQVQLSRQLERMSQEQESLSTEGIRKELDELVVQESTLKEQLATMSVEMTSHVEQIGSIRDQNRSRREELAEIRNQLQQKRGRLSSLEALQQAAVSADNKHLAQWLENNQLDDAGRLIDQISVDSGWETALEMVLGNMIEALCIDDLTVASQQFGQLREGVLTLLENGSTVELEINSSLQLPLLDSRVQGPVALKGLLSGVYCANDLAQANHLRSQLKPHESIITSDGIWMGSAWVRYQQDQNPASGVLARKRDIETLQQELHAREAIEERLVSQIEQGRQALVDAEARRDEMQQQINALHRDEAGVSGKISGRRMRLEQIEERLERIKKDENELKAQIEQSGKDLAESRQRLSQALSASEALGQERNQRQIQRDELKTRLDTVRSSVREVREQAHQFALQMQSLKVSRDGAQSTIARISSQTDAADKQYEELGSRLKELETGQDEAPEALDKLLGQRSELEKTLAGIRDNMAQAELQIRELEQKRVTVEKTIGEIRESLEGFRIKLQELKVRRETADNQLTELNLSYDELDQEIAEEVTEDDCSQAVEELVTKISRLGPINLAAIDEFEEQNSRKEYLDQQNDDLVEALTTLENAIRKIDRETRTRFKETFDRVNQGVQQMFPRLFGGGHAFLEMTDDDLLNTGVLMMARPPGKRISHIQLMSGGEKALTAIALVFAIFELNPAPFCMLDEVDAPLDEANVGRFCDLVRDMSEHVQFIVITHNKNTMEIATQLMGVTMSEAGVSRPVSVDMHEAAEMVG